MDTGWPGPLKPDVLQELCFFSHQTLSWESHDRRTCAKTTARSKYEGDWRWAQNARGAASGEVQTELNGLCGHILEWDASERWKALLEGER